MKIQVIYNELLEDINNINFPKKLILKDLFYYKSCIKINDIIFIGNPTFPITKYMHKLRNG